VLLVAALTFRDLRRNVGAWRLPALSSILFALLFVGSAATSQAVTERARAISYSVAVDGDLAGATELLANLDRNPHLIPDPVPDAARAVRDSDSALGLTIPDDLDAQLRSGTPVTLVVHERAGHNTSVAARGVLDVTLRQHYGEQAGPLLRIAETDVSEDPETSRDQYARTLAALTAFLCLGVVTSVAALLGSTRERRGAEPLLVLPLHRSTVARGTALGALPMAAVYLGAGLATLVLAALLPLPTLHQPVSVVLTMVAPAVGTAAVLGALSCALGVLAGSLGGGADDSMGLGDLLAIPLAAVGVFLLVVPDLTTSGPTAAGPAVGPLLVFRDAIAGQVDAVHVGISLASTAIVSLLLLLVAARLLGTERNIRRV
jgi:ABC-type Na+ efflux pump permease subunit